YDYDVQHLGNDDSDPPNVTLDFSYTIQCLDASGSSASGTISITMTREELAANGVETVAGEVYDEVERIAESLCSASDDGIIIA
ncbi:MAG: hypothetical protein OEY23_23650, partial [Acidimicrobiia bacterium]|nr:hypothetical protein [Acidimicrobiia bacterium]